MVCIVALSHHLRMKMLLCRFQQVQRASLLCTISYVDQTSVLLCSVVGSIPCFTLPPLWLLGGRKKHNLGSILHVTIGIKQQLVSQAPKGSILSPQTCKLVIPGSVKHRVIMYAHRLLSPLKPYALCSFKEAVTNPLKYIFFSHFSHTVFL